MHAPADPHAPRTLAQLTAMSRVLAATVRGAMGLTADDLLSCGWLGYVSAADRGLGHAGCMARARGAMLDAMRTWDGTPFDHQTGARTTQHVPLFELAPVTLAPAPRSRLPRPIRRALAVLTPRERTALHCWTVRGWSHEIIADHLGVTTGTSGRVRHDALAKLRAVAGASCDRPRRRASSLYDSASVGAPACAARTLVPSHQPRVRQEF